MACMLQRSYHQHIAEEENHACMRWDAVLTIGLLPRAPSLGLPGPRFLQSSHLNSTECQCQRLFQSLCRVSDTWVPLLGLYQGLLSVCYVMRWVAPASVSAPHIGLEALTVLFEAFRLAAAAALAMPFAQGHLQGHISSCVNMLVLQVWLDMCMVRTCDDHDDTSRAASAAAQWLTVLHLDVKGVGTACKDLLPHVKHHCLVGLHVLAVAACAALAKTPCIRNSSCWLSEPGSVWASACMQIFVAPSALH
jgi:hypothetical protein